MGQLGVRENGMASSIDREVQIASPGSGVEKHNGESARGQDVVVKRGIPGFDFPPFKSVDLVLFSFILIPLWPFSPGLGLGLTFATFVRHFTCSGSRSCLRIILFTSRGTT
jgi:hypothetical protein